MDVFSCTSLREDFPRPGKKLGLVQYPLPIAADLARKYALECTDTAEAIRSLGVEQWCLRTIGYRLDGDLATDDMQRCYAHEMARTPSWFAASWFSLLPGLDFTPFLGNITCPTLLLTGDKSVISTREEQQMMQRVILKCELLFLESVRHGANLVPAERCARTPLQFLGVHPPHHLEE